MKYIANPVEVDAFQISKVWPAQDQGDGSIILEIYDCEVGRLVQADKSMVSRMMPKIGDYWVIQSDDYTYLNPKDVFERKYHAKVS